jgi:hypothetical protein
MQKFALVVPALLLLGVFSAQADVYAFSYTGYNSVEKITIYGSGTFTTGTAYSDGYLRIISITGTTEAGTITGLDGSGGGVDADPPSYYTSSDGGGAYYYDNAFLPGSPTPFTNNGLLFEVSSGSPYTPINIFSVAPGLYEYSYGESNTGSFTAAPITFTATLTPEPGMYGVLAVGMIGLLLSVTKYRRRCRQL